MSMISVGFSRPGDHWIGREIDRRTGGRGFCHAFLVFHDLGLVWEAHADFGVRFKDRGVAGEELIPLALTAEQSRDVLRAATLLAGNGYDFAGVAHFVFSPVKQCPDRQFCSEAVVLAGQAAGLFGGLDGCDVSPNALYGLLAAADPVPPGE